MVRDTNGMRALRALAGDGYGSVLSVTGSKHSIRVSLKSIMS